MDTKSNKSIKKLLSPPNANGAWNLESGNHRSINISGLFEDNTIDARNLTTPNKYIFEPTEMTGRSTTCIAVKPHQNQEDLYFPSVAQILANSFSEDVRGLSSALEHFRARPSNAHEISQISNISNISSISSLNGRNSNVLNYKDSRYNKNSTANIKSCSPNESEQFLTSDQVKSKLNEDEKIWDKEYASIPRVSIPSKHNKSNLNEQYLNKNNSTFEFSTYNFNNRELNILTSMAENIDYSMGTYFRKRSEEVKKMIPNLSPPEKHKPIPLVNLLLNNSSSIDMNSTENKILENCDSIAGSLDQWDNFRSNSSNSLSMRIDEETENLDLPLADILCITQPIPLYNIPNTNGKVQILKYEECYGDLSKILGASIESIPEITANTNKMQNNHHIDKKYLMNSDTLSFTESLLDTSLISKLSNLQIQNPQQNISHIKSDNNIFTNNTNVSSATYISRSPDKLSTANNVYIEKQILGDSSQNPTQHKLIEKSVVFASLHKDTSSQTTLNREISYLPLTYNNSQMENKHFPPPVPVTSSSIYASNSDLVLDGNYKNSKNIHNSNILQERNCIETKPHPVSPGGFSKCNSRCSSISDLSEADGYFCIKSSHREICWGSTKLRKSIKKSITIKNTSHKKLSIKMEIIGPGFQISDIHQSCTLILQSYECRTISVTFCPTIIGPALGKLCFHPIKEYVENITRIVYLYGYGGNTVLQIRGIEKGPTGPSFLKLGDTKDLSKIVLERSFVIYNKGPLNGVAVIRVKSQIHEDKFETSSITVTPNNCIIEPDSIIQICVTFKPRRSDLKKLLKKQHDVITVANLEVVFGDDPNRQRVAGLIGALKENNEAYKSLDFLCANFENEQMEDFSSFLESTNNIFDLFALFKIEDIALTLNRTTLNETTKSECDLFLSGIDDTMLFRTLEPIPQHLAQHVSNTTTAQSIYNSRMLKYDNETLVIRPNSLHLNPFGENTKTISIKNICSRIQTFELVSNFRHLLECTPSSGIIEPCTEMEAVIKIKKTVMPSEQLYLTVFIENGKIDIPIYVDPRGIPPHLRY